MVVNNYYNEGIKNSNLYSLIYYFEKTIKEFIFYQAEQTLKASNGAGWKKVFYDKINKSLLDKVEKNKQVTLSKDFYISGERNYTDMEVLDFSFIKFACIEWWDVLFHNFFINKLQFEAQMDKLSAVRNSVAHCRKVTDEEQRETSNIIFTFLKIIQKEYSADHFEDIVNIQSRYEYGSHDLRSIFNQFKKVYDSRGAMVKDWPLMEMVKQAKMIEALGISINELTIKFDKNTFVSAVKRGAHIEMLFLDPFSENTIIREVEENVPSAQIKDMTLINLRYMEKIKQETNYSENLKVYIYNEIPRFNMLFINEKHLFLQYYAHYTRGEDNPCFHLQFDGNEGLFNFYHNIYSQLKSHAKPFTKIKKQSLFTRGGIL